MIITNLAHWIYFAVINYLHHSITGSTITVWSNFRAWINGLGLRYLCRLLFKFLKCLNLSVPTFSLFFERSAGIYLLKVNYRNTINRCGICSKLAKKTPERRHLRHSGVFIFNFEHISYLLLMFLILTLNM